MKDILGFMNFSIFFNVGEVFSTTRASVDRWKDFLSSQLGIQGESNPNRSCSENKIKGIERMVV